LFFIAGILTSQAFQIPADLLNGIVVLVSALILSTLLLIAIKKPGFNTGWLSGLLIGMILFVAGMFVMAVHINSGRFIKDTGNIKGMVIMEISESAVATQKAVKTTARIKYWHNRQAWIKQNQNILLYFEKDSPAFQLKPGNHILGNIKLNPISSPANPGEFDYCRYMAVRSIYHQAYLSQGMWRMSEYPESGTIKSIAYRCQLKLLEKYRKIGLNKTLYSILSALTLGYKSDLDTHTRQLFSKAGVMHVMALSGFNVAVIAIVLGYLLFFADWFPGGRLLKTAIIVLVIWTFAFITGLSASVTRAAVMISLVLTGSLVHRNINTGNILFASAFIILTVSPSLITDISFQLSFSAVLGIIVFQPPLYRMLNCRNTITDKIWQLFTLSCAAQLSTIPLTLFYFHQFPVYFWLSNLYVVPLVSVIICVAGIFLLFSFVEPLMIIFGKLLAFLLNILYKGVVFTEILPYSVIENIRIGEMQTIVLILILFFLGIYIWQQQFKYLVFVLGLVAIFQIIHVLSLVSWNNQELILIGSCKGKTVINLIEGRHCTVLTDGDTDSDEFQYALKSFWIEQGVAGHIEPKTLDTSLGYRAPWLGNNLLISFAGKQIVIMNENVSLQFHSPEPLKIDLLVITGDVKANLDATLELFSPDRIVIDASVKNYQAERWVRLCEENAIDCWVVFRQGACLIKAC
jgi:competence protein ComEC